MNIAVRTDDRFTNVDGLNIRYLEEGKGVPAIMLHGVDNAGKEFMRGNAEGSSAAALPDGTVIAMVSKTALGAIGSDGSVHWSVDIGASDGPLAVGITYKDALQAAGNFFPGLRKTRRNLLMGRRFGACIRVRQYADEARSAQ